MGQECFPCAAPSVDGESPASQRNHYATDVGVDGDGDGRAMGHVPLQPLYRSRVSR